MYFIGSDCIVGIFEIHFHLRSFPHNNMTDSQHPSPELTARPSTLAAASASSPKPSQPASSPPRMGSEPLQGSQSPSSTAATTTSVQKRPYSRKKEGSRAWKTDLDKLVFVLDQFPAWHWTFDKLLKALIKHRLHPRVRKSFHQFKTFAYETLPQDNEAPIDKKAWATFMDVKGWDITADLLRSEIAALATTPCFGKYSSDESNGSLTNMDKFTFTIRETAPNWCHLLHTASHPPGKPDTLPAENKHMVILSQLCNSMHRSNCDNFSVLLGLYMFQGGCRRRVLDCMNNLGLSKSYTRIRLLVDELSKQGQEQVRIIGSSFDTVATYDNFEYTDGKRGERMNDQRTFRSITTGLIFPGQGLPQGGLLQSMWKPEIPLKATDIVRNLPKGDVYEQV
jgi:hypothetical protein